MAEAATATTTTATPTTTTAAATTTAVPWHEGKVAPEVVGFWQNKGYDMSDPIPLALKVTEQYREAEKRLGVPSDQLLRLPRKDAPETEIKNFWQKLGAPADAKDYDFSGIKFADGSDLDDGFVSTIRDTAGRLNLPKDVVPEVAKAVVKFMDAAEAAESAEKTAKLDLEKAELAKNWGGADSAQYKANKFIAEQGAKVLGITPEAVKAMENAAGYKAVMEAMHRVGILNKEDRFIASGAGSGGGSVMTKDQASARKAELMADKAWTARYNNGDTTARREMVNLNRIITGDFESAA